MAKRKHEAMAVTLFGVGVTAIISSAPVSLLVDSEKHPKWWIFWVTLGAGIALALLGLLVYNHVKEADFKAWVTETALLFGWRYWHVPAPMRATNKGWVGAREAAGLPDLILIHDDPPRLVFAELKGTGGKLTVEQRDFLMAARDVADCAWDDGEISSKGGRPIGVYVWESGQEQLIETLLRTRVLT